METILVGTQEDTKVVQPKHWSILDQTQSDVYQGLSLFEESILEYMKEGHTPTAIAKMLGCSKATVFSRIHKNTRFQLQFNNVIQQSHDVQVDDVLTELHRIALNGQSESVKVKASESFLKAHNRIQSHMTVKLDKQEVSADDILHSLGIH